MNVSTVPAATSAATEHAALRHGAGTTIAEGNNEGRTAETQATHPALAAGDSGAAVEFNRYQLSFRMEEGSNRIVVQVIDAETKQVVRSVPAEDVVQALRHAAAAPGALIDRQV